MSAVATLRPMCTSAQFQVAREADAIGLKGTVAEWYVHWRRGIMREQEEVRADKRRKRESRWASIAAGEREPLTSHEVTLLWPVCAVDMLERE